MIQLNSDRALLAATQTHLNNKQADINNTIQQPKASRAKALWKGKKGTIAGRAAFNDIEAILKDMSGTAKVCHYCGNYEATDIEHIYPKSIFPERTFVWENYLLVCKTCNLRKKDKFYVFSPSQSNNPVYVTPPQGESPPPTTDAAFINPRLEDPLEFLQLDLTPGSATFMFRERAQEGSRSHEKAKITLELLDLNNREALRLARRNAYEDYLYRLNEYISVKTCQDFDTLQDIVGNFQQLNRELSLDLEKNRIQQRIITSIKSLHHPVVWEELKDQQGHLHFQNAQEALNW